VEGWRGWGPVLVQRMLDDAVRFAAPHAPDVIQPRSDDMPLPGERETSVEDGP